jgi:predicted permease
VAVISDGLWHRRFGGARDVLGRTMPLDTEVYTVIGVMPAHFGFPDSSVDIWVTRLARYSGFQPEQIAAGSGYLTGVARLAPGVPLSRAQAESSVLMTQYRREHPRAPDADPNSVLGLTPLQESLSSGIRPTLAILAGAVALVLLIACANVAALVLARANGRARELAVRAAMGAGRGQLIRQLLAESLLLAGMGAALGISIAVWAIDWLVKADAGNNLPGYQPIRLDFTVLAFTIAITVLTAVAFGLIPALQASRPNLTAVLRDGGWGSIGRRGHRGRSLLVIAQVALSMVLLISAGLLLESFRRVQRVPLGFDPGNTLTARISLPPGRYPDGEPRARFIQRLVDRVAALPGVTAATAGSTVPFGGLILSPLLAEGQPVVPPGQRPLAQWSGAAPGYFRTLGIALVRGREFTWADDAQSTRVLIVSEDLARAFWPNENPLGKHVTFTRFQTPFEIVGVVAPARTRGLEAQPLMQMYTPYAQWTFQSLNIALRTRGDAHRFARLLGQQVASLDPSLPVTAVRTMEELMATSLSQRRQTLYLVGGFAAVALVLALIGLYGVMAYSVAQRTAEFGIRQAIGAPRQEILRLVLLQGVKLSLTGVAAGALAAVGLTRLATRLLYGVSATDPIVYGSIAVLLLIVTAIATLAPAWRATRVDPIQALRQNR